MDDRTKDDDDEQLDPRIVAGWQALEAGDVQEARAAAEAILAESAPASIARRRAGAPAGRQTNGGGKTSVKSGDGDVDASRMDALLLRAACAREEGDTEIALESLAQAAKEDPEWCTPELWMAELLSEDADQLDEALRHARRALDRAEEEEEYLAALAAKASIELDLGRPTEARKTLSGLPAADVLLDDPAVTLDFAQLLMDADAVQEARVRLKRLTDSAPDLADGWYLQGVAAELMEDEEAKRTAWIKTRALDLAAAGGCDDQSHAHVHEEPVLGDAHAHDHAHDHDHDHDDDHHHGVRLSEDALVAVAEETLAGLPADLRAQMKNVPIVVAEVPAADDVAAGLDPRLLGLFSGTPHAEGAGVLEPASLTEIVLFRRNIERMADDEESLREEVRTTLLHEAGHFFGLDEAGLAILGLQ